MKKIKVKPRELTEYEHNQYVNISCARIRKPVTEGGALLKEEGEFVPETTYWLRRLKAGDVVKVSTRKSVDKPTTKRSSAS